MKNILITLIFLFATVLTFAQEIHEKIVNSGTTGQVLNVKAYGAKCDGSTDDTTAIQNAINAAHAVKGIAYVPPSSTACVVASFLRMQGGVTLVGTKGSTIVFTGNGGGACTNAQNPVNTGWIRWATGGNRITGLSFADRQVAAGTCLMNLHDASETSGVEIDHNNIVGASSTTETNTAIFSYAVDTINIHNNVLKDWSAMIVGGAHTWARINIENNVISTGSNNSNAMISTPSGINCFGVLIRGNVFEGYGSTNGISSSCANGLTIADNYFGDASPTGGTWIQSKGTLIDNYISSASNGKALSGSFIATGNSIYGPSLMDGTFTANTFRSGPAGGCFVTTNQGGMIESIRNNFARGTSNSYCHANSLTPHPIVRREADIDSTTRGVQSGVTLQLVAPVPNTLSTFPACTADTEGNLIPVTDSTANTIGATIRGGGANHVRGYCDGTNWTVAAR